MENNEDYKISAIQSCIIVLILAVLIILPVMIIVNYSLPKEFYAPALWLLLISIFSIFCVFGFFCFYDNGSCLFLFINIACAVLVYIGIIAIVSMIVSIVKIKTYRMQNPIPAYSSENIKTEPKIENNYSIEHIENFHYKGK